tara:strand:+ start:2872 stop:3135 length:264 start_codon:yes stop_codon:yes gene_type:complete
MSPSIQPFQSTILYHKWLSLDHPSRYAHDRTLQGVSAVPCESRMDDADYLERCLIKRSSTNFNTVARTSPEDATELIEYSSGLKKVN